MKGERYEEPTVKAFENWLDIIPELQTAVEKFREARQEKAYKMKVRIKQGAEEARPVEPNRQTAQIVKPRLPPAWSGQRFETWRKDIKKLSEGNRNPEEQKYEEVKEMLKNVKHLNV